MKFFSAEHRKNLSLANLGKKHSEETRRKLKLVNLGRVHSEETKKKMSLSHLGKKHKFKKRGPLSEETRRKISVANTGYKHSPEALLKMSLSNKGRIPWNKGTKTDRRAINYLGESASKGAKHKWFYQKYGIPDKCEKCGVERKDKLIEWSNIDHKYRRNLEDWRKLCRSCHRKYDYEFNSDRRKQCKFKDCPNFTLSAYGLCRIHCMRQHQLNWENKNIEYRKLWKRAYRARKKAEKNILIGK